MPAVQTNYTTMSAARAGQIAEWNDAQVLISRSVDTVAGVGFGLPVQQGATDRAVKAIGDGAATGFVGVTVRSQSQDANVGDKWAQGDDARVMRKGSIWVPVGADVAAGDAVYFTPAGVWTNTSNTNANTLVPGARWDVGATNGNLAELYLG